MENQLLALLGIFGVVGLVFAFGHASIGGVTAMDTPEYIGDAQCIAQYQESYAACVALRWAPDIPGCVRITRSEYLGCDLLAQRERPPQRGSTVVAQQQCDRSLLLQRQACPRWPRIDQARCWDEVQMIHEQCIQRILETLSLAG